MDLLVFAEIMGTVAFAASGAAVGMEKKMDIFGVAVLGLTTATGGGILRDLVLNITPPAAFKDPVFAVISVIVSLILFIPYVHKAVGEKSEIYDRIFLIMDSVGLGLFTVIGIRVAKTASIEDNFFLVTFVGVLTGVGGGLLRDIFAGDRPYIFIKHFYACAAIIGAWICAYLWDITGESAAMIIGASVIVLLRLLAAHYRWSLPKAG